jgi:alkylation response protein AidB-like acyl-CoA dehydrogenase
MDLNYTEEQSMLRDSVASFLNDNYSFEQRNVGLRNAPHWRKDIWTVLAKELGVLGAPFPEKLGGFGGGAIENMVLMEEFGRALVVEPYIGTVVIGGGFLKYSEHQAAADLITQIMQGEVIMAFAQAERESRFNLNAVNTKATPEGSGWLLNGHKRMVIGAPCATHLIVTARTAGDERDRQGISVLLVERDAPGVTLNEYVTYDGFVAADVTFDNVSVGADGLIGEQDNGLPLIERVVDEAIAATCGEAVGVLRQLLESTLEFSKQRVQFGKPISSFQVLQHRMADMFMSVEQAASVALLASIRVEESDLVERARSTSVAKAYIGKACRMLGQNAIQLHGGMGMSDEMAVSHYFKRATMLENRFGSVDHHLAKLEQLSKLSAA